MQQFLKRHMKKHREKTSWAIGNTNVKHWISVLGAPGGCPALGQFSIFDFDPSRKHCMPYLNPRKPASSRATLTDVCTQMTCTPLKVIHMKVIHLKVIHLKSPCAIFTTRLNFNIFSSFESWFTICKP